MLLRTNSADILSAESWLDPWTDEWESSMMEGLGLRFWARAIRDKQRVHARTVSDVVPLPLYLSKLLVLMLDAWCYSPARIPIRCRWGTPKLDRPLISGSIHLHNNQWFATHFLGPVPHHYVPEWESTSSHRIYPKNLDELLNGRIIRSLNTITVAFRTLTTVSPAPHHIFNVWQGTRCMFRNSAEGDSMVLGMV